MSAMTRLATDAVANFRGPTAPNSATSWLDRPANQQPSYPSETKRRRILATLAEEAAPVSAESVAALRGRIEQAARGEAFILQMGDCAEPIADANRDAITRKIDFLDEAARVLGEGLGKSTIKIGRIAGQYAKPRSQPLETRDGVTLPAFRGESINGYEFDADSRAMNPLRLRSAYLAARKTHGIIRSHNQVCAVRAPHPARVASEGVLPCEPAREPHHEHVFTSHEALDLVFEDALSRDDAMLGRFNALGHLVWIGARTNHPDHAHALYCASLANPVAVKVSAETPSDFVQRIHRRLNPRNEPGRLIFISRMGASAVKAHLPRLVGALEATGANAVWMCDPMHGNTFAAPSGIKARSMLDIRSDLSDTIDMLAAHGHGLAGVHLETSPDEIAECVGSRDSEEELRALGSRFRSKCDPRLNYAQTIELCHWLVAKLAATKARRS
jgi:3-deoxy-7-phosphoheptulonate synthase